MRDSRIRARVRSVRLFFICVVSPLSEDLSERRHPSEDPNPLSFFLPSRGHSTPRPLLRPCSFICACLFPKCLFSRSPWRYRFGISATSIQSTSLSSHRGTKACAEGGLLRGVPGFQSRPQSRTKITKGKERGRKALFPLDGFAGSTQE